jgi:hypothetical protein
MIYHGLAMDTGKSSETLSGRCARVRPPLAAALWCAILIAPLVVGLVWGPYFSDDAYVQFRIARNLSAARPPLHDLAPGIHSPPAGLLYALALALLARAGLPPPQAGLILSTLGWGVAAGALYNSCRALRRPAGGLVSAALLTFSPLVLDTLGLETSWVVAWAWVAVAAALRMRWRAQAVALALMLSTHLDAATLVMALLLLVVPRPGLRRPLAGPDLIVVAAALAWGLLATLRLVAPPLPRPDLVGWISAARQLLGDSELYWLSVPLIGLGLFSLPRRALWTGAVAAVVALATGGVVPRALVVTAGLFLAGLGIDWLGECISRRSAIRLAALTACLTLAAALPLGIAQASSFATNYRLRPVVRQDLERDAADWLRAHSEPGATVFGPESVGYRADRPTLPWTGDRSDQQELVRVLRTLNQDPPAFCVSFRSIAWLHLTRTRWFQENYAPLQHFEAPADAASPFTMWGYRFGTFDLGEYRPMDAHLPEDVEFLGYRYWPDRIRPGDAVYVTLYLQAAHPVTETFRTIVRVISPGDGTGWAQRDAVAPPVSVLVDWWQRGQPIAQRFVLTTTSDIPLGAHHLEVSVAAPGSNEFLPVHQGSDPQPIDRIALGYVVVPWQGEMGAANVVGASFGDEIRLLGFEAPESASPGEAFDVRLYWEAQQPPQEDYVVFVHLLDADGQLVAGHDGAPVDGRYATRAWVPGETVPDAHRLALAADTPPGVYLLQAGLYRWPGLERLPVRDSQGNEQPAGSIGLQSIEVE